LLATKILVDCILELQTVFIDCLLFSVVPNWFRRCKESADSTTREGFVDLPLDAAAWLIHFKNQNAALLNDLKVRFHRLYIANIRL
jgi:hypothetical protein